jgi:SNF2 family DNA or RNA helicase
VLPQVHWLRVILDEGHTIGSSTITNKLQMATELRAERRWVMTGGG